MIVLRIIQIFITWLAIASLVGIAVKKLRMPYTVGLVLVGTILALLAPYIRSRPQWISPQEIRTVLIPNLILAMLVPPLVFEAAFHIKISDLRKELKLILAFAIPGVLLSMLLVGGSLAWLGKISLPVALVFGALVSATDPVAVVALFRSLGAPRKLVLLLEGESLFNDGTAIVLFHLMLGILTAHEFRLIPGVIEFLRVAVGGLLIGVVVGFLASFFFKRVGDNSIEISVSIISAFGSYLLAESFHFSGVLAVVTAGLISGNTSLNVLSEGSRERLVQFWEYAAFLANTFVFLIIGLTIDLSLMIGNLRYGILAILAVLAARAVVIYGFSRIDKGVPLNFQHVLYWGGLRGAISLALALSLTSEELGEGLGLLQAMAFVVVLFTLLIQGTTMAPLLRRLKLIETRSAGEGHAA